MDLQRSLLIGAICVLSFMLLTQWVAFKDAKTAMVVQDNTRLLPNTDTSPPTLPETQRQLSGAGAHEDIPTAPEQADAQSAPAAKETEAKDRIVQVYTDVLQLAIDLNGGDIVELSLPKYLEHLDNPNIPFVLLEDNDALVYIAQSGLIGVNGIDQNGRAQFTASAPRYTLNEGEDSLIVDLQWQGDGTAKIIKRLTLHRGEYLIDVDYLVENTGSAPWQANLFGQIKRQSALPPSVVNNAMGLKPFLGVAITQPDDRFTKFTFNELAEEPFKAQLPGGWIALIQHYFLSAWIPNPDANAHLQCPRDSQRIQHCRIHQPRAGVGPR